MGGDAEIGDPISPSADEALWTPRRRRLQAAIAQLDDLYADLYGRAIDALSEQPLRAASLVIAGHCVRDLVNGLPDVLKDVDAVPAYSNLSKPAQELSDVWEQHHSVLSPIDGLSEADIDPASPDERVTVPTVVMHAARNVVRTSRAAVGNGYRRYSALVLGRIVAGKDPTVHVFRENVRVFEKLRHPQRGRHVVVEDDTLAKLVTSLEVIERALEGRLIGFFEALDDLRDVIDAANERDGVTD